MIFLKLFLTFLKIGTVSFGGGYGMISLIREDCLAYGWLTEEELLNFIAVAESTPGPIAVNMATFVGSAQAGFLGAVLATLGVILPSFLIILLIATLLTKLLKYASVKATLNGIKPAIVGIILATAVSLFSTIVFHIKTIDDALLFEWKPLCIFAVITFLAVAHKKWKKKIFSPILLILCSGVLGILFFAL
jgi:chromate transporter